jgi:hypothetical protein
VTSITARLWGGPERPTAALDRGISEGVRWARLMAEAIDDPSIWIGIIEPIDRRQRCGSHPAWRGRRLSSV